MKTTPLKQLISDYHFVVGEFVKKFERKQDTEFQFWVDNRFGTIGFFADSSFHFDDIVFDLETKQKKGLIFEWFNYVVDATMAGEKGTISYQAYVKGARY